MGMCDAATSSGENIVGDGRYPCSHVLYVWTAGSAQQIKTGSSVQDLRMFVIWPQNTGGLLTILYNQIYIVPSTRIFEDESFTDDPFLLLNFHSVIDPLANSIIDK